MNLLLDTQVLLWWREGSRRLGPRARAAIESQAATVRVSAASAWEIAIKTGTGRLKLQEALDLWLLQAIETSGFRSLSVTFDHAVGVANLPPHHGDPFDRVLIAQARLEELTIVTSDAAFNRYDVRLMDSRQ